MFCGGDNDLRLRNQLPGKTTVQKPLASVQPKKTTLKSTENAKQWMEVQGSHRPLFYRQPSGKHISSYSTVVVNLEGSAKKVSFESTSDPQEGTKKEKSSMVITLPMKSEKRATKGTQTNFRESEAQTLPWKHEIKAEGKILSELLSLDWLSSDEHFPPGAKEASLVEKARQKLAWEDVIERLRGKENAAKRKLLVLKMTVNESTFKEKAVDEENQKRLEISRRQLKEAKEVFEEKLWCRLQRSYGLRRKENDIKIDRWSHELMRKIRKMKSARERTPARWNIIEIHKDKSSELYAPKLRNGDNPWLGHEEIEIQCRYLKRFHGLEVLEKHMTNIFRPKFYKTCRKIQSSKFINLKLGPRLRKLPVPEAESFGSLSLKKAVPAPTPEPPTPKTTELMSDSEERLYQAALLLGSIIKGRSVQTEKFLKFSKLGFQ